MQKGVDLDRIQVQTWSNANLIITAICNFPSSIKRDERRRNERREFSRNFQPRNKAHAWKVSTCIIQTAQLGNKLSWESRKEPRGLKLPDYN